MNFHQIGSDSSSGEEGEGDDESTYVSSSNSRPKSRSLINPKKKPTSFELVDMTRSSSKGSFEDDDEDDDDIKVETMNEADFLNIIMNEKDMTKINNLSKRRWTYLALNNDAANFKRYVI